MGSGFLVSDPESKILRFTIFCVAFLIFIKRTVTQDMVVAFSCIVENLLHTASKGVCVVCRITFLFVHLWLFSFHQSNGIVGLNLVKTDTCIELMDHLFLLYIPVQYS